MQVFKQVLNGTAKCFEVAGDDVHVIPGTHGAHLFLDLHAIHVAHLALDVLDGGCLINRLNMQAENEVGFHIQKVSQQAIFHLRRQNLNTRNRGELIAHGESFAAAEIKAAGCNEILG